MNSMHGKVLVTGIVLLVAGLANSNLSGQTQVPQVDIPNQKFRDFYEAYGAQLDSLVRARLDEEREFLDEIVELVRVGTLPKSVVDRAWLWVRSKRAYANYPFPYFEQVLRMQTERLDIELPEFDRSIYSQVRRNRVFRGRR